MRFIQLYTSPTFRNQRSKLVTPSEDWEHSRDVSKHRFSPVVSTPLCFFAGGLPAVPLGPASDSAIMGDYHAVPTRVINPAAVQGTPANWHLDHSRSLSPRATGCPGRIAVVVKCVFLRARNTAGCPLGAVLVGHLSVGAPPGDSQASSRAGGSLGGLDVDTRVEHGVPQRQACLALGGANAVLERRRLRS